MKALTAVVAGAVSATAMSVVMALLRLVGVRADFEAELGNAVAGSASGSGWVSGVTLVIATYSALGLLYGAVFEYGTRRAGWRNGALLGGAHFLVLLALLLVRAVASVAPTSLLVGLAAPGSVALLGVLHVAYGALVGRLYGTTRGEAEVASRTVLTPRGREDEAAV